MRESGAIRARSASRLIEPKLLRAYPAEVARWKDTVLHDVGESPAERAWTDPQSPVPEATDPKRGFLAGVGAMRTRGRRQTHAIKRKGLTGRGWTFWSNAAGGVPAIVEFDDCRTSRSAIDGVPAALTAALVGIAIAAAFVVVRTLGIA
jgi:hypothetical protein